MHLGEVKEGEIVEILEFPEGDIKSQAIRFGIDSGQSVYISQVFNNGPVVIKKGNQEIAIGRNLAEKIKIKRGRNQ